MKLKNKIAIITGAASGFGKGIAKKFSEDIKNYQKSHIKINTNNLSINDLCNKIIKGIL